jgi:hypothetical protein
MNQTITPMTFAAWDQVVRELEAASIAAQQVADWPRHREITDALALLRKLWNADGR